MIKHIVCFKIKEEYKDKISLAATTLKSMEEHVPNIKSIQVGVDFLHSSRSYDIILEVELENKEELEKYQNDPYHCSVVKKLMHEIREASIAVDYEE